MQTIKTIDINARTWFDKVNGNSYFSAIVVVDYGLPTVKEFKLPFQYGYGEQYVHAAKMALVKNGLISENDERAPLWSYCEANNIILRYDNQKNCLKREVVNFVK